MMLFRMFLATWLGVYAIGPLVLAMPKPSQELAPYTILFYDEVAEPAKIQYTKDLEQEISLDLMDTLTDQDVIFLVSAMLTPDQVEKWHTNIVESITLQNSRFGRDDLPSLNTTTEPERTNAFEEVSDILRRDTPPGTIERQNDPIPNPEVRFFSQPKGVSVSDTLDFVYKKEAGSGVEVFVHDLGMNLDHKEFTWQGFPEEARPRYVKKGRNNYFYPRINGKPPNPPPTTDWTGHGTCVADKVSGFSFGIAKGADLILVPTVDGKDGSYSHDWHLAGLKAMANRLYSKKKSSEDYFMVVVISWGFTNLAPETEMLYRKAIKKLADLDAVIVVAAGNSGTSELTVPAKFALTQDAPYMIVVGGLTISGRRHPRSNFGPKVKVGAPYWVECADSIDDHSTKWRNGTSFAAPVVAGLAAYLISTDENFRQRGTVAKRVAEKIWNEASYPRFPGELPGVWNMENSEGPDC